MLSQKKLSLQWQQRGNSRPSIARSNRLICKNSLGDAIRDFFDFEKWAPRSSQAWRFGQEPIYRGGGERNTPTIKDDDMDVLNNRLKQVQSASYDNNEILDLDNTDNRSPSFTDSTDEELAQALNLRLISQDSDDDNGNDSISSQQLNGKILVDLIYQKYGKKYDVSFVKRDLPGFKTIVSFNIYHAYLGQRSFPMSEQDYLDKLDGVAFYLEAWGQSKKVIDFLKEPVQPRRGLPSRPVIGNAVTLQLDLSREQISEWFGS